MAQGRMLKKQISESKKLGSLKSDSARLLYTWLIPWLDIEGRYSADPEILKGHLFPKVKSMTPTKIQKLLHELAETDLIILYRHKGEQYFQFSKFGEMQTLHPDREAKSEIPPPNDNSCELMSNHDLSLLNKSKIKLKKESCPNTKYSDVDIELSSLLIEGILKNNPRAKAGKLTEKQKESWHNQCRLLRESGWSPDEIRTVIEYTQQDEFEIPNVQSMGKLRDRFDNLALKARREIAKKTGERDVGRQKEGV